MQQAIILITALLPALLLPVCVAENVYYVTPNSETACPSTPCHNLSYYTGFPQQWMYFRSNTTFQFLPGTHILDTDQLVHISSENNIVLKGHPGHEVSSPESKISFQPSSKIWCTKPASFVFEFVENLLIANLSFTNCGSSLHDEYRNRVGFSSSAIQFVEVTNLTISHVVVQNSTGYGMISYNPGGSTEISQSALLFNHGDTKHTGGNMLFIANGKVEVGHDCSNLGANNTHVTLIIRSTNILYGHTPQPNPLFSQGLEIVLGYSCTNVDIKLHNVTLSYNGRKHASNKYGGNLRIFSASHPSVFRRVTIVNCYIEGGVASYAGGGIAITIGDTTLIEDHKCLNSTNNLANRITISNTVVTSNTGGGVSVYINACTKYTIEISQVTFYDNKITHSSSDVGYGGNLQVSLMPILTEAPLFHFLSISNSTLQSGIGPSGGGAGIVAGFADPFRDDIAYHWMSITNTLFIDNVAESGGGMAIMLVYPHSSYNLKRIPPRKSVGIVHVHNSTFIDNTAWIGSAVFINNFLNPLAIGGSHYFTFEHTLFHHNHNDLTLNTSWSAFYRFSLFVRLTSEMHPSTAFFSAVHNVTFSNSEFTQNSATALTAERTNIFFHGNNCFKENNGTYGGGLQLLLYSFMHLLPQVNLLFIDNHANRQGGAIYFEDDHTLMGNICFLTLARLEEADAKVDFINNTAVDAADAIYGNPIKVCKESSTIWMPLLVENIYSVLNISGQSGNSIIATDPQRVCFCEHSEPNCTKLFYSTEAFPGEDLTISLVAVGQENGTVPGTIHANIKEPATMGDFQELQITSRHCTNVTYTVFSNNSLEIIELTINELSLNAITSVITIPQIIRVHLRLCPLGFALTTTPAQQKCDCVHLLQRHGFTCDIRSQTVERPQGYWVGYANTVTNGSNKTTIILHQHCPFDYCISATLNMSLTNPNQQCSFNRSGILCGKCKPGLSLVFGTSQCLKCSNMSLLLIFAFIAAGLLFVVLLSKCNITISKGTLNGLILYANIIQMNKGSFFTLGYTSSLAMFISWLNLDLGIQTCFYDGMDMYAKAWLQFVFPVYIWVIVLSMIVSSHYSTTAAKVVGRNAPQVLATLFLLSYTKVIRTVIAALAFTSLEPKGHPPVWLYDGSVQYLSGKHIPLFLTAVIALLTLSIPYTLLILLAQCLQRSTSRFARVVMRRSKPIIDAHTGPYKDKYRFWAGLLLLVRIFLLVAFAGNISGDPSLNLLLVLAIVLCLLALQWAFHGLYKQWPLDILEAFFLVNTGMLSATTLYLKQSGGNQAIATDISVSATITVFIGIIVYHIATHTTTLNLLAKMSACYQTTKKHHKNSTTTARQLVNIVDEETCDESDSQKDSLAQPCARVQPLRLTFDENNELVLVANEEN